MSLGPDVCGELEPGLRREWLVTNGIGGYASGTVAGVATRRYHGLLVAALEPPVGRTVLVGGLADWAEYDGERYPLFAHEFAGGTVTPEGYRFIASFELDGMLPVWTFALADARLERRIWLEHGANTAYVTYRLVGGTGPVTLELTPLVTRREFHSLQTPPVPDVTPAVRNVRLRFPVSDTTVWLASRAMEFVSGGDWWWNFHHREEAARGLDARSDLYAPGRFAVELSPGESATLVLSTTPGADLDGEAALASARRRQTALLELARAGDADPVARQLVLAADQFVAERRADRAESSARGGKTVIAGYPWFNDWGRDTMIALPGLTLATGRSAEAADLLLAFAPYVRDGLLPNNFPDRAGADAGYNTVDAALWYVLAAHAYHAATGDLDLILTILPALRSIVDHYTAGTRYGIGVDPADGLLRAGEPGWQLTWMDAKVGGWVVTPRIGKPVEINALWYNALRCLADLTAAVGDAATSAGLTTRSGMVQRSFVRRFRRAGGGGGLADVVDTPEGDDWTVRPNQIFAASLPFPVVDAATTAEMVTVVGRELLAGCGLRSLDRRNPAYRGEYGGDPLHRDGAYHQGTVWTWLLGPYAEAFARVHGSAAALELLRPVQHHLAEAGLGTIGEIQDGAAPHRPRGCIAQAWSVAEVLRVWRKLAESG